MTLSKNTISELESLKNSILHTESLIDNAKSELEIAHETENDKYAKTLEERIDFAEKKIKKQVSTQAESMGVDYILTLDLIFDREYTLSTIQ